MKTHISASLRLPWLYTQQAAEPSPSREQQPRIQRLSMTGAGWLRSLPFQAHSTALSHVARFGPPVQPRQGDTTCKPCEAQWLSYT